MTSVIFIAYQHMKKIENKTILMKYIELQKGVSLEELLHSMYIEQQLSIRDIAEELGIHYHTVNSWLDEIGIKKRLPYETLLNVMEIRRKLNKKHTNNVSEEEE